MPVLRARANGPAQFLNTDEKPAVLQLTLGVLDIGTKTNVAAIQVETPLISVLNMFVERNVSALPIVDQEGAPPLPQGCTPFLARACARCLGNAV